MIIVTVFYVPYRQCQSWTKSHCHAVNTAYWKKQRSGANTILLGGGEHGVKVTNSDEIREYPHDIPNQGQIAANRQKTITMNHQKQFMQGLYEEHSDMAGHDFMNLEHNEREANQVEIDDDGADPCEKIGMYENKTRAESRIAEVLAHNLHKVAIERNYGLK